MVEGMGVVQETRSRGPLFCPQTATDSGSRFKTDDFETSTTQVRLQHKAVVACTENDPVVFNVRHVEIICCKGVG